MKRSRVSASQQLRTDFLPKEAYLSRDFVERERQRLWPRVWQPACRAEELPRVGDYVVYDIGAESILLVRSATQAIKAFYNVCQHRGRPLRDGVCGHAQAFQCRFHGWRWKLDGTLDRVVDRHDWEGCPTFSDADLRLKETRVEEWGGWLFINMDPDAEPLHQYLKPVPEYLDPLELGKMRYRWYKTALVRCNWKVALEAFSEAYHVATVHPQLLDTIGQDITQAELFGKHGMFLYNSLERPFGTPSPRTGKAVPEDVRPALIDYFSELERTLGAIFSPRSVEATSRLMDEVPSGTPPLETLGRLMEIHKQAAIASGAGWPDATPEQLAKAGTNWHVFPNLVILPAPEGAIVYRARPNGDDPDSCLFDVWSLLRYAPGMEPRLKREFYADASVDAEKHFGLVLSQDFQNMGRVQHGMKSRGFSGARTNPKQEASISNMHRALYEYLDDDP